MTTSSQIGKSLTRPLLLRQQVGPFFWNGMIWKSTSNEKSLISSHLQLTRKRFVQWRLHGKLLRQTGMSNLLNRFHHLLYTLQRIPPRCLHTHCFDREKQDDKLARQKKIPPLVSIKPHLHTMPTWKNAKRDQSFKPVAKQGKIPPLIPVKTHSPALPRNRVPISLQCHHRNRDYEFSHFGYPSQHPSQGVCRSQIIFPPCSCSCMRSMACGMYLVPDVPPQVPANVLMRFA